MRRECCRCHCSLGPDIPDPTWYRGRIRDGEHACPYPMGEAATSGYCTPHLDAEFRDLDPARAAETTDPGTDPGNW